jgi:membrane protease YdiL (CAAX protease family)
MRKDTKEATRSPDNRDRMVVMLAIVYPTLLTLAYFVWLAGTPWQYGVYVVGKAAQFILPAVWVAVALGTKLRWPRPTTRGLALGLTFGLLVGGAMILLYQLVFQPWGLLAGAEEAIRQKVQQLNLDSVWWFAATGIFYALGHSLMEEYYWRWFVFGQLRRDVALTPAILISSAGFMAHHVVLLGVYFGWTSVWTYLFSLAISIGGGFWAWLYEHSQSIYGPWLSHLLIDAAIFLVGFWIVRDQLV